MLVFTLKNINKSNMSVKHACVELLSSPLDRVVDRAHLRIRSPGILQDERFVLWTGFLARCCTTPPPFMLYKAFFPDADTVQDINKCADSQASHLWFS